MCFAYLHLPHTVSLILVIERARQVAIGVWGVSRGGFSRE